MADEPMTEEEARRRFVAYLIEVDARGPAPDCEQQLAAINAEFDAECERLLAEEAEQAKSAVDDGGAPPRGRPEAPVKRRPTFEVTVPAMQRAVAMAVFRQRG